MKNLFISQPMSKKTDEEISKEKQEAIEEAKCILDDDINVIDSFILNAPNDAKPLWYLGQSILLLAQADIVYFAKGWRSARGCVIEHRCATEYGLITIETN